MWTFPPLVHCNDGRSNTSKGYYHTTVHSAAAHIGTQALMVSKKNPKLLTRIFRNIALSFGGNGSLEGILVISLESSAAIHFQIQFFTQIYFNFMNRQGIIVTENGDK